MRFGLRVSVLWFGSRVQDLRAKGSGFQASVLRVKGEGFMVALGSCLLLEALDVTQSPQSREEQGLGEIKVWRVGFRALQCRVSVQRSVFSGTCLYKIWNAALYQ